MSIDPTPEPHQAPQPAGHAGENPIDNPSAGKPPAALPPLFRPVDWLAFALTFLAAFIGYQLTLAPDVTLQDSGELAVGSYYAGVPHPPGYPVWTIYTWLATVLYPVANVAYRVAVACAFTSALACGLLALQISRGSSMIIEGIVALKGVERRVANAICVVSGFVGGCLLAFNGFYWSQSVIVEVYCFGVFSFMITMCCMMRWLYAPHQYRYLYLASFVFGICFTNHQTLLVATMGIEVAILAAQPRLGRDVFWFNTGVYLLVLLAKSQGYVGMFDTNLPLFLIFNAIGVGSLYTALWFSIVSAPTRKATLLGLHLAGNIVIFALWLAKKESGGFSDNTHTLTTLIYNTVGAVLVYLYHWFPGKTSRLFSEWKPLAVIVAVWFLGAGMYFYMPLTSMTNPPMNWGYPRTYDGFIHALTRGQYERTNPTSDLGRFFHQLGMYAGGAVEEFNAAYLLLALVPFFFLGRMQKRERSWLTGLLAIWFFLGILLVVLLNPSTDKQSRDLHKVFFNASFSIIAIFVGYGLALLLSFLYAQYRQYRKILMFGLVCSAGAALYAATLQETSNPLLHEAHYFGIAVAMAGFSLLYACREKPPLAPLLGLAFLMPAYPIMSHWAENEQHNHLFGFWFGHDMFTPPDFGKKGELYPEMARDAILFGGTDPGRFCPTYMIFCESFIPPQKRRDPNFDRRDVYIITQNALADGTYLNYIRAHYNRSTQIDPPFFQQLLQSSQELKEGKTTNLLARLVMPVDSFFTALGKRVEDRRRREGVYPPKEIHTPLPEDCAKSFDDYMRDVQQRMATHQLKPNEDVRVVKGKLSVSGQVAVMQINGLLTKVIFDQNPEHEFYVEESMPLDWMYPHLTPFGIIMKINREPVKEFTEEMIKKDHLFWSLYSDRLIGNWITYETKPKEICDFVKRVYLEMDFRNYPGSREFARDNDAQKAFSKLRSAIAGLYAWRTSFGSKPGSAEQKRLRQETEFAMKQAFAYCPYSPEAVFKYANLLVGENRIDEAIQVAETCQAFDPENPNVIDLLRQLRELSKTGTATPMIAAPPSQVQQMLQAFTTNPGDFIMARQLAAYFNQAKQPQRAGEVLDLCIASMTQAYHTNQTDYILGFNLASILSERQKNGVAIQILTNMLPALTQTCKANPDQREYGLVLAQVYFALNQPAEASKQLDAIVDRPPEDNEFYLRAAQMYAQMGNASGLEHMLIKIVQLMPDKPEAWFDLAVAQAAQSKNEEALKSLSRALTLHRKRMKTEPGARDLVAIALQDPRFETLRKNPEFKKLVEAK
jgi:thioredoxin-like negative regulator of GroEL